MDSKLYLDRRHKTEPLQPTQQQIDEFNDVVIETMMMDEAIDEDNGADHQIISMTDSDISTASNEVDDFLSSLGLPPDCIDVYAKEFKEHDITIINDLKLLNDNDLKNEIGIKSLGHRRRILHGLESL